MTNKKTEELNEAELDEVTGGNFEIQRTNKMALICSNGRPATKALLHPAAPTPPFKL